MKKILAILTLITSVLPLVVLAAQAGTSTTPTLPQLDLLNTMVTIANLIFWILLALSIIFIVYGGILFVTAAGSQEQVEKARHIILYAAIGIVIAILAYAIRSFLLSELMKS